MFTNEKEKEREKRERSERVWEGEKKGVKCTTVDCDVFGRGEKKEWSRLEGKCTTTNKFN